MSSLSASHAETEAHAVTTTVAITAVHVVMITEAHAAMTEAQEVHAATVVMLLSSTTRTTNQKCSRTT
jgi:hypothetical protein